MDAETDENAFYFQLVPLLMARLRIISIASPEPRQAILELLAEIDGLTRRKTGITVQCQ